MASSWCRDLWHPLDDLSFEQALANVATTTVGERHANVSREHLISDYACSRNIARFGLKFATLNDLWKSVGLEQANFFFHEYMVPLETKIEHIAKAIEDWRL